MPTFTKLDVAKRQLETAIKLFFLDDEPISVHALAMASLEVLVCLQRNVGMETVGDRLEERVRPECLGEWRKKINAPKNFFKHADRDPSESLEFSPDVNDLVLLVACIAYMDLTKERPPLLVVLWTWVTLSNPDLLADATMRKEALGIAESLDPTKKRDFFEALVPRLKQSLR